MMDGPVKLILRTSLLVFRSIALLFMRSILYDFLWLYKNIQQQTFFHTVKIATVSI